MSDQVLLTERHGNVAVLRLNRPDQRNALNAALRQALIDTLDELADDDAVNVVVLTGQGSTFCAGFDLKELESDDDQDAVFANAHAYHHAVHTFPKPLIAAIEGHAVAGGMDLALMCDLRVGSDTARFGQPQVKFGVPAAYDLLTSVVPMAVARDLCLTGRIIEVNEAVEHGIVQRRSGSGDALDDAMVLAAEIATVNAAGFMKRLIVASQPDLFDRRSD